MGGREGHVCMGLVFFIIGLWHLCNNLKNNTTLKCFKSYTWFPTSFSRYLEIYLILIGSFIFILVELHSSPIDHNGEILATHLHHTEHTLTAMPFFLYALFVILLDKLAQLNTKAHVINVCHFLAAMTFAQELLLIHFHSTDHVARFTRSLGVTFQGLWFIVTGFMLWTPDFAPKGCLMKRDQYGRDVIQCEDPESLHRGNALVTILFCWVFTSMMVFGGAFYLVVNKVYGASKFMEDEEVELTCEMEDRQKNSMHKQGFTY